MKFKIWQLGNGVWTSGKAFVFKNGTIGKPKIYTEHSSWQSAINWVNLLIWQEKMKSLAI